MSGVSDPTVNSADAILEWVASLDADSQRSLWGDLRHGHIGHMDTIPDCFMGTKIGSSRKAVESLACIAINRCSLHSVTERQEPQGIAAYQKAVEHHEAWFRHIMNSDLR